MIREVLPPDVHGAQCYGDVAPDGAHPDELAAVRTATAARRGEFHTVRVLARRALTRLAPEADRRYEEHSLLPDARGAPTWPLGVVGSMTHSQNYRAAVVADSGTCAAIGLDAESNQTLPPEVSDIVCRAEERSMIRVLSRHEPSQPWSCVIFSAKESIYKAWYPLTKAWLGFDEISVQIEHDSQTFRARLMVQASPDRVRMIEELRGRWVVAGRYILTTAYLPAGVIEQQPRRLVG